jgi:hypothetical protein
MYPQAKIDSMGIPALIEKMDRKLRFVPGAVPCFVYSVPDNKGKPESILEQTDKIVDELLQLVITKKESGGQNEEN